MQARPTARLVHSWEPLNDLTSTDRAIQDEEMATLASVWATEQQSLGDGSAVKEFNRRLKVEWAIETGIIERIYTLDRGVTQLLIERGVDASLIPDEAQTSGGN